MKVGILGTGDVGKSMGNAFLTLGHQVKMGSREANNEKALAWATSAGVNASVGTFGDAASFGELVVVATLGTANVSVLRQAGVEQLAGKLVWDATNPLDFGSGGPRLATVSAPSSGEEIQRLAPEAKVVKVFNTVGNALFFRPKLAGAPGDMFLCGNDAGAKERTAVLVREFGWEPADVGGIDMAHYLEAMCPVWVLACMKRGNWAQAFKLIR